MKEQARNARKFGCASCSYTWEERYGTGRPDKCPVCGSANIHRTDEYGRPQMACRGRRGPRTPTSQRRGRGEHDRRTKS